MSSEASVVVIGGGVMGASTAYHLVKSGLNDVVLLDRKQLTSGTTWHSAAQVRQLRSTENLTRLIQYSANLYAELEMETGQSTGWLKTGSLSIATNPDRRVHIRRQADLAGAFDVAAEIISPQQLAEFWPLMRTDDVLEAVWSPDDGRVNPSDLVAALIKGARAMGLTVFENTPVTEFGVRNGRIESVATPDRTIVCEKVVNCAGLWGRELAAMAGVGCPLHACEHFYLLTRPIGDGLPHLPTLSDHDRCLYIRDDVGGLLVGCFEPNPKAIGLDNLPKDFCFDLLNEDWDHFEPMLMNAIHRIPALETAESRMLLNGPESFTPDGAFIMGESPELPGFFLGCGMNSMGIASGGGAGMALARWIVDGHPPMDLTPVDARRFSAFHNNVRYLRERIPETLALHYAISYPGREPESARDVRVSPLHQTFADRGAHFVERSGWERPGWFDEGAIGKRTGAKPRNPFALKFGKAPWHELVAREHLAARERVAIFDQSSFGKLEVGGPDSEVFLQRICANNLAVPPGRCVYTQMLNDKGGIESDLVVMRMSSERYLLITGTAQLTRDLAWLKGHRAVDERVSITDLTSSYAVLSVAGPDSRALLSELSANDFSDNGFRRFSVRDIEIGTATALASRVAYSGSLGWELYVSTDQARNVYRTLINAGSGPGPIDAGIYALTSLRVEKGFRAWGHDIGPEDSPLDAGLGFAVKFDKPFLGREALMRRQQKSRTRVLASIVMDNADTFIQGHEPVWVSDELAGEVTSAAFGHSVGRCVALGWLRGSAVEALSKTGRLEVEIGIAGDPHRGIASLTPPL